MIMDEIESLPVTVAELDATETPEWDAAVAEHGDTFKGEYGGES